MSDPRRTDGDGRLRVSILVNRETWAEFQAELIRQGIPTSEGPTTALRCWLDHMNERRADPTDAHDAVGEDTDVMRVVRR